MKTLDSVKSDYELERGKPIPTWNHAVLQKRILVRVESRYEGQFSALPELNLSISGEKLVPDLAIFIGPDSFLAHDKKMVLEMPVTTVEILLPSQTMEELTDKAEQYLGAGVKSCWIVVPSLRNISVSVIPGVYQTFNRHETLHDPVTGIELDLSALFS